MSDVESGAQRVTREEGQRRPSVDDLLVRSVVRWALLAGLLTILYDLAILYGYPFPDAIEGLRRPFYTIGAVALLLAIGFITFLGYRLVSFRVVRSKRLIYVIFLPAVLLLSSIAGFLLLTL
jgi:hypothetical protein